MSPALTRRGFAKAGAATLGASVMGIPMAAEAAAQNSDADLLALIARYAEVAVERNAHAAIHDAAEQRFKAAVPPRPAALTATFGDTVDGLPARGREKRPDGRLRAFFDGGDVRRLREAGPMTECVWSDDNEPPPPVPNPRAEARRQQILAAHDGWEAEKRAVADRVGLTAAETEDDRLYEAVWSLRDAIRETPPATFMGLRAKAAWTLTLLEADEEHERIVRDLAAFGQVTS